MIGIEFKKGSSQGKGYLQLAGRYFRGMEPGTQAQVTTAFAEYYSVTAV